MRMGATVAGVVGCVLVWAATEAAQMPPNLLGFGSRAGMEVTLTSSRGLDTTNAIIVGRITARNAMSYCREYAGTTT